MAARWSPRLPARFAPRPAGWGAIDVLKSVSRTMSRAADQPYLPALTRARQVMATYADMQELIRLGAYRASTSPEVDEAIRLHKPLEAFLAQGKEEATSLAE
jgi:flagellum-specific ATP synthase